MLRRLIPLLLGVALVATAAAVLVTRSQSERAAFGCPRGFVKESEPGERDNGQECARLGHPESQAEVLAANAARRSRATAPFYEVKPGAGLAAAHQAAALRASQADIPAANGLWSPLGTGPLDAGDPTYDTTNGQTLEGFKFVSGRIEDFAYDPAGKRLFASAVNGGVWQSDDMGGSWKPIGDGLPTQVVGALAWTPANGGTLIALTGDPAYGGSSSSGLGIYRSTDDGATWQRSTGAPAGVLGFEPAVDPTDPDKVYAATGAGLLRSTDGGASFTDVTLPTGPCAGHTLDYAQPDFKDCFLANMVTDVVVQGPANDKTSGAKPGAVLAAVGWRAGQKANADGKQQSPNNGIYVSDTGAPGSFQRIDTAASGFAGGSQASIGRVALGIANGQATTPGEINQDHNTIYALVEDANKFNGKAAPDNLDNVTPGRPGATVLLGVYVSTDFGKTWTLMESANRQSAGAPLGFSDDPTTGSALVPAGAGLSYEPGVQAWYNEWVTPDPTLADDAGVPLRVNLGLEEIWENDFPAGAGRTPPKTGRSRFRVIGRYWNVCDFEATGIPKCSPSTGGDATTPNTTTTHPDQHAAIYVPDGKGGVTIVVGNDGGVYTQHVDAGQDFENSNWAEGKQGGSGPGHLHTLQPYDVEMAKDGTAYMGLQDNGEGKILPDGTQKAIFGGDGFFTAVDPDNSKVVYEEYTAGNMSVSQDGGQTWRNENPGLTSGLFVTPFKMDPTDAKHLIIGGREVDETVSGPETVICGPDPSCNNAPATENNWVTVFDLGTQQHPGDENAASSATDPNNQTSATEVYGANAYIGYCGFCDVLTQSTPFKRGLATNVAGKAAPKKAAADGWHIAKADGLPNRIINSIAMDPNDPKTIFVALGGYGRKWAPPGATGDALNAVGTGHVFRSTDAGQTFTDVSGDLPDSPANWVVLHGDQIIVGNDVGAFISTDPNGTAYAPLGNGLPNVPVLHITPKPGDPSTLVVATYGRGAYTYRFAASGAPIPGFTPKPTPTACAASGGFTRANVRVLRRGVRFDVARRASARARVDVFQVSTGRRVLAQRLVKRFRKVTGSFSWSGRTGSRGRLRDGYYFARFSEAFGGGRVDVRRVTLQRVGGRFHLRPSFYRRASCGLLTSYK